MYIVYIAALVDRTSKLDSVFCNSAMLIICLKYAAALQDFSNVALEWKLAKYLRHATKWFSIVVRGTLACFMQTLSKAVSLVFACLYNFFKRNRIITCK